MKSDDIAILSIPEIKTVSPLSTPRDQIINATSEDQVSKSSDSSDSSPSDLRRRLKDLPSPNEFTLLADRVAALGRRIDRKRELFLCLHGVANRIEENDEWEGREQRAEPWENSLGAFRSKDARARRRARIRPLKNLSRCDDKAMVISKTDGNINSFKIINDKSNLAESSVNRSTRDADCLRLPVIKVPRRRSRFSSFSEPSSTRYSYNNNNESRDNRSVTSAFRNYRSFMPRDNASKSADFPSFPLNNVRPKRFGRYRPSPNVILSSDSESVNETNRELSSARKTDNSIATLELSSPESKIAVINEPVKKMPIMSARNDITESILPNLSPSSRSFDATNNLDQISQDTLQSCLEQVNHDGYITKTCNKLEAITHNVVKTVFNERARCDELVTKTCNKFQIEPKCEDVMHDKRRENISQNTSIFSARSFIPESAELVTNICNERIDDDRIMKTYNKFKQIESDFKDNRNQKEETKSYVYITSKIHRDEIKDQFIFDCPTNQSNFEINSSKNIESKVFDASKRNRLTNLYTQKTIETPHSTEIYLQKETLSSKLPQNNNVETTDNHDQEIITKVPTLALNSQDISYSTSASSREYSATQSLDPQALIKALSNVSLKQKKQEENVPRKCENFYVKNTIDSSSRASDFRPAKGETWHISRSSKSSKLPRKSRVPSRIPIRIHNSKIISATSVNQLSGCYKSENSNKKAKFQRESKIDQNDDVRNENIVRRRSHVDSSYSQVRKPDPSLRSTNGNIEVKSGTSDGEDTEGNDHKFENVTNSQSPPSTPFDDYVYDRTRRFSKTRTSSEKNYQFLNKAVYFGDRKDYAKIDDDVRSRSDRSKSADTVDVTSVTESPYILKYKRNEEEENIGWRTEDDCASINDEENSEIVKGKDYYNDEKSMELCLQTKEHFMKLGTERTCDPSSPFTIQRLKLNPSSEIEKSNPRKQQAGNDLEFNGDQLSFDPSLELVQSENLTLQIRRKRKLSRISSSTFNLNCESKRKKKSQERFPFTISEASATFLTKHQDANDYPSPDKNLNCSMEKTNDRLEEKTANQLQMHPSITRLSTSGLEDTMTDILCCVAQEKKETESKSRMKTLVRIFSSKLRRVPKHPNDNKTSEPAKIIYENCQVNSKANSCSNDSLTEETRRINFDKPLNNRWIDCRDVKYSFAHVFSENVLKKTESLQTIVQKHPYRRYDRDNLWIQDIKNSSFDNKKDSNTSPKKDKANNSKENLSKDPYSIFLVNVQSDKLSNSNIDHSYFSKQQHDVLISDYVAPSDERSKHDIDRKIASIIIPEEIEDPTGCSCWRLCCMIAPSKYRSSIREQVSSSKTRRSGFLLWKRKK